MKTKSRKNVYIILLILISFLIVALFKTKIFVKEKNNVELETKIQEVAQTEAQPIKPVKLEKIENFPKSKEVNTNMDLINYEIEKYKNPDIVGYLNVSNTTISYPVVQSKDNDDYLNTNYLKQSDSAGTIFQDYENDISRKDKNVVVYGHNMKRDIMFHDIRKFKDKNFFDQNKYVEYTTLNENNVYEIFSFSKANVNFAYNTVFFKDAQMYEAVINKMKEISMHKSDVDINKNDRVLTLSTCSSGEADYRLVIFAKLIRSADLHSKKGVCGGIEF